MKVLDLFAGIGGFSLGLERAGPFETVAFCEIDPYCQKVLAKHWPGVPIYDDIKEVTAKQILADAAGFGCRQGHTGRAESHGKGRGDAEGRIDIITGGFPCQDISHAGKRAGIEAERSGLWSELARVIGEVQPRYAIIENVSALLTGGDGDWFATVLADLAEIGFDAEWHCISAAHLGAPHIRDRIWMVAYPGKKRCSAAPTNGKLERIRSGLPGNRFGRSDGKFATEGWWLAEPDVGRVAHGVPHRMDRIRCLGNAIVPPMAEYLGKAIMQREHEI